MSYSTFKNQLADLLIAKLVPIREEIDNRLSDRQHLDDILDRGAKSAQCIATETMVEVRDLIGLKRR